MSIIDALRRVDAGVPLVVMTYYNIVGTHGAAAVRGLAARLRCGRRRSFPTCRSTRSARGPTPADAGGVETVLLAAPARPTNGWPRSASGPGVRLRRGPVGGHRRARALAATARWSSPGALKAVTDKPVLSGSGCRPRPGRGAVRGGRRRGDRHRAGASPARRGRPGRCRPVHRLGSCRARLLSSTPEPGRRPTGLWQDHGLSTSLGSRSKRCRSSGPLSRG